MTEPKRYRKLPVLVDAMVYDGTHGAAQAIIEWASLPTGINLDGSLTIPTLEGDHKARVGDFIIRGVAGEFYPCKPDIFAATYEEAPDDH